MNLIFTDYYQQRRKERIRNASILVVCLFLGAIVVLFCGCRQDPVYASEIVNVERLADAIKLAENSKTHPYGILAHYKTTTPRQACLNTINHALKDFKGGDFIAFLGSRYCPVNCENDNGTNKFWVKNVKRLYQKGLKND
jgi:hypothetical protein